MVGRCPRAGCWRGGAGWWGVVRERDATPGAPDDGNGDDFSGSRRVSDRGRVMIAAEGAGGAVSFLPAGVYVQRALAGGVDTTTWTVSNDGITPTRVDNWGGWWW